MESNTKVTEIFHRLDESNFGTVRRTVLFQKHLAVSSPCGLNFALLSQQPGGFREFGLLFSQVFIPRSFFPIRSMFTFFLRLVKRKMMRGRAG